MSTADLENPTHDDFEVVSRDSKFGGYEVLKHKDTSITNALFFRKAVTPSNHKEFDDMMDLQKHVLDNEPFGTVYPVYTHDDRKWVVMSVTKGDPEAVAH